MKYLNRKPGHKYSMSTIMVGLIILSLAIQDLKITQYGIRIGERGAMFVYELLIILFCTCTVILKPKINIKPGLLYIYLLFTLLFLVNFLLEPDVNYLIGYGSFRMFLICSMFFVFAIFKKHTIEDIKLYVFLFVLITFLNSLYSLFVALDFLPQVFEYNVRLGSTRYSGFSYSPAYFGNLASIGFSLLLPFFFTKKSRTKVIVLVSFIIVVGIFLSMNRTGIFAASVALLSFLFLRKKIFSSLLLLFVILCFVVIADYIQGGTTKESIFINEFGKMEVDEGYKFRFETLESTALIIINHPLGISWGSFEWYDPLRHVITEPHNLYALIALYGGILALALFVVIIFKIMKPYFVRFNSLPLCIQSVCLGVVSILAFGIFEISLYHVMAIFPLNLFLAYLASNKEAFSTQPRPWLIRS